MVVVFNLRCSGLGKLVAMYHFEPESCVDGSEVRGEGCFLFGWFFRQGYWNRWMLIDGWWLRLLLHSFRWCMLMMVLLFLFHGVGSGFLGWCYSGRQFRRQIWSIRCLVVLEREVQVGGCFGRAVRGILPAGCSWRRIPSYLTKSNHPRHEPDLDDPAGSQAMDHGKRHDHAGGSSSPTGRSPSWRRHLCHESPYPSHAAVIIAMLFGIGEDGLLLSLKILFLLMAADSCICAFVHLWRINSDNVITPMVAFGSDVGREFPWSIPSLHGYDWHSQLFACLSDRNLHEDLLEIIIWKLSGSHGKIWLDFKQHVVNGAGYWISGIIPLNPLSKEIKYLTFNVVCCAIIEQSVKLSTRFGKSLYFFQVM